MAVDQKAGDGIAGDTLYTKLNTTADSTGVLSKYSGVTFIYSLSETVSDRIIMVLQDFFKAYPLGIAFNSALQKVAKQVNITDQFSADTIGLPQVVVNSMPMDTQPISLGNKLGKETYNDHIYEVYSGIVNINTTFELYDSGKPNVGKLADIILLALMQYVREQLKSTYMTLHLNPRFSNPTKVNTSVDGIYRSTITVQIITEWNQYMEIETVDADTIRDVGAPPDTDLK